ncbi:hypothetical protein [Afipia sp. Root123D2]|uniref:hypothetical protein n=1 Tax=Afipia sp. Root123D2 TaxID=1736436 RepID=UPI0012E87350|nr:hypothetical protein [Afipia sp. Root123D2]
MSYTVFNIVAAGPDDKKAERTLFHYFSREWWQNLSFFTFMAMYGASAWFFFSGVYKIVKLVG